MCQGFKKKTYVHPCSAFASSNFLSHPSLPLSFLQNYLPANLAPSPLSFSSQASFLPPPPLAEAERGEERKGRQNWVTHYCKERREGRREGRRGSRA